MIDFIIYNGNLLSVEQFGLPVQNRSFRYGDGVFESIRCNNGVSLWIEKHCERLVSSAKTLKIDFPDNLNPENLKVLIRQLLKANNHLLGARVRLSLFREDGGLYRPKGNNGYFLIESSALEHNNYLLNNIGLKTGFYNELTKSVNRISFLKSSSSLLYVMAGLYGVEKGWDEVIILNENGYVAEAGNSNLFVVEKDQLLTPALDQGCVDGVMRRVILDLAVKANIKVSECALLPKDLLHADEVFLTNAIRGIQWVKGIQNKRYYHKMASDLMLEIQKIT